ncbi:DUF5808 domain-containing protein [Halomonas denitrificans]|nr:hypothetical protein [Halomonas denitrificans]
MNAWMLAFAYLLPTALGGLMLAMPRLGRGSTFFAVTVPAGFAESPAGRAIRRTYRFGTLAALLLSLAAITPLWRWLDPEPALAVACTIGSLGVSFGAIAVFVVCRQRAMAYSRDRSAERRIELMPPDRLRDIVPRPLWIHAVPYLPVVAAMAWLAARIGAPVGPESASAPIDPAVVYGLPLLMLATLALMHLIMPLGLLIRRLPGHRSRVEAINRMVLWMMLFLGLLGGWNALAVLYGEAWIGGALGVAVNLGCTLAVLLVPVVMWRAGSFARPGRPDDGDRSPDAAWKLGLIYYNPDDPALWLEKRFGVGYTLNFGRPAAWWIIGAILAATGALVWVALP